MCIKRNVHRFADKHSPTPPPAPKRHVASSISAVQQQPAAVASTVAVPAAVVAAASVAPKAPVASAVTVDEQPTNASVSVSAASAAAAAAEQLAVDTKKSIHQRLGAMTTTWKPSKKPWRSPEKVCIPAVQCVHTATTAPNSVCNNSTVSTAMMMAWFVAVVRSTTVLVVL